MLNHLYERDIEQYMYYGQEKALFTNLFDGRFKNETEIKARYEMANQKYRLKLRKLYLDDLARLRNVEPSGRLFIETYERAQQRFDLKWKRDYRFIAHPKREKDQMKFILG